MLSNMTIPHMNDDSVFEALERLGTTWSGQGCVVECGTWLGASTVALAKGLIQADFNQWINCYDIWKPNSAEVEKAKRFGLDLKMSQDISEIAKRNIQWVYHDVKLHRGKIDHAMWDGYPIEFFILDAAKREPSFGRAIRTFSHSWIPDVTVIALLDYTYWQKEEGARRDEFRVQERWVETNGDKLIHLKEYDSGTAQFFRVIGQF